MSPRCDADGRIEALAIGVASEHEGLAFRKVNQVLGARSRSFHVQSRHRSILPWHDEIVNTVESPEFGGRFTSVRRIGEGGFGVVYEAVDTKFGGRVAVKVLRADRVASAARFKREFRSLVDVQHANLVKLFELAADGDTLYFSMELIDGVDFLAHVTDEQATRADTAEWPPQPRSVRDRVISAHRLRAALVQLVAAVQALHDAGKLHCDVKPSNVLVDATGRVVLLDFGLVANVDESTRSTLGTPGYMAPEQVAGGALTVATDWYGVGAVLYEALTGALPRPNTPCTNTLDELRPLALLCDELLDPEPNKRPTGREVLVRLGSTGAPVRRSAIRLIGRNREEALLKAAWLAVHGSGSARIIRLVGESGIGKTALVEQVLAEIRDSAWILAARCYEQESVPYKAIDGAVDALAEHLASHPAAASMIPARAGVLAQVFPVLTPHVPCDLDTELEDSQATRRRAFQAFRELLFRMSAERPIVLFIDDAQWGDIDSARLLAELVRPPNSPRMLVIATHRPTASPDGFLATLDEQPLGIHDERIELDQLSDEDSRRLAEHLVGDEQPLVARIGREAAGNPLFIQQLAAAAHDQTAGLDLRDVILARVATLDLDAQRLVQTVALSAGPIDEEAAIQAAEITGSAARTAMLAVRQARLVTARSVATTTTLEPAHDRVREAVATALDGELARQQHLRIADTLLGRQSPDPDALVYHLLRAGDRERTRVYALVAAERAERALAFDRAAAHLQLVLELGGEDRALLFERHGDALANAGRAGEAAESFERAADARVHEPAAELVLRRRAGELTLRSGRIELGMERMKRVLHAVGVTPPRSRTTAGLLGLIRRIRLFARGLTPRVRTDTQAPDAKARLEALWSASTGLSMVNHVVADALGLQHMHEALTLGDRSHLIRGLGYEAAFEAVIGGSFLRKRCGKILAVMDELANVSVDPYDRAWAQMSKGVTSWFAGDWRASWENCDAAAKTYHEQCRGVAWELAICDAYRLPALAYMGELRELAVVVPHAYAGARERGDLYAMNLLRLGQQSMTWLVEDRPDVAIEEASAAVAPFPESPYLLPHYHHLFAIAQAELYRGNPAVAWRAIEDAWKGLDQSRLLMVQCLRCEIRHLHARAAIALAPGSEREDELRAVVRAEARKIERDDVAPSAPFAAALRAALVTGDDRRHELEQAFAGFEAAGMRLYANACRHRLGAAQRETALAFFAVQGIKNPERMVAMLVPGT
jgi:hypothetical protein